MLTLVFYRNCVHLATHRYLYKVFDFMGEMLSLMIIWLTIFIAHYAAYKTKLTPVLWFLFLVISFEYEIVKYFFCPVEKLYILIIFHIFEMCKKCYNF